MKPIIRQLTLLVLAAMTTSCAILQGDDKEKKARTTMAEFQKALAVNDIEVLKLFNTDQSNETILSAIDIMQNSDTAYVRCRLDFSAMRFELAEPINEEEKGKVIKVTLPTVISPTVSTDKEPVTQEIVFWLMEREKGFYITSMEADEFYSAFSNMRHDIVYAKQIEEEIKKREEIYALARKLEEKYDSVVWYARYGNKTYFYVVSGSYNEEFLNKEKVEVTYQMGLVDEDDKLIVPIEYYLVGTLGSDVEDAVEVLGPNGYGYYSLSGKELVPAEYSQIIPYPSNEGWIVQSSGQVGWIGNNGKFSENLPSKEIDDYVAGFQFIPASLTVSSDTYSLCERPRHDEAGSGAFIAPSYWVQLGISQQVQFGLTTTASDAPIGGWTDYTEVNQSLFEKISDGIGLIVFHFKEHYLEGREEFYESNRVMFTDNSLNTVLQDNEMGGDIQLQKIDSTIIELRSTIKHVDMMYGGGTEYNVYAYFQLGDGGLSIFRLESGRNYPETEYAYLDSTYLSGTFMELDEEAGTNTPYYFAKLETLQAMHNDVMKANGFTFEWDFSRQYTREDLPQVSKQDLHNLNFLARMIINARNQETEGDV